MKIVRVERYRLPEDPNRAPIWLIGLTDLITILLAFFILLYSTTQPRTKSFETASESLRDRFGTDAAAIDKTGEAGSKEAQKTWKSAEEEMALNLDYLMSLTKKYIAANPALNDVTVWRDRDLIILSFGAEMGFDPGKADLSEKGLKIIDALAPFFDKLPNHLEVVGHADETPLSNTETYQTNWQLSLDRANHVAQALSARGYDSPTSILGRGTSDAQTLPGDLDRETRNALARRVDLRLNMVR